MGLPRTIVFIDLRTGMDSRNAGKGSLTRAIFRPPNAGTPLVLPSYFAHRVHLDEDDGVRVSVGFKYTRLESGQAASARHRGLAFGFDAGLGAAR